MTDDKRLDLYSELAEALGCDPMDSHAGRIDRAHRAKRLLDERRSEVEPGDGTLIRELADTLSLAACAIRPHNHHAEDVIDRASRLLARPDVRAARGKS